jgi:hypothetical protein
VCCALVAGGLCFATPALSGNPKHVSFKFTDSFVGRDTCAAAPWRFDINDIARLRLRREVFYDANGNFLRSVVHLHLGFTISANGLRSRSAI